MNDPRTRSTRNSRRVGLAVVAGAVTAAVGLTATWATPQLTTAGQATGSSTSSTGTTGTTSSTSQSGTTLGSGTASGTSHAVSGGS